MLYHAERTIYEIDADYSNENWHEITWGEAYNLIWRRLDRDYRNDATVKDKMDFIQRNPNEVIVLNGNLFQWIP